MRIIELDDYTSQNLIDIMDYALKGFGIESFYCVQELLNAIEDIDYERSENELI